MGIDSITLLGIAGLLAAAGLAVNTEQNPPLDQQLYYKVLSSAPASTEITPPVKESLNQLKKHGWDAKSRAIVVEIPTQRMLLFEGGKVLRAWKVSTSKKGVGSEPGSYKTPVGVHRIWQKSGSTAKIGQPLKGGEPTDAPVSEEEGRKVYISTRALKLEGLEENNKTSRSRGIWIHGTTAEEKIGTPASIGCVRMRNIDVVDLFNSVKEGTLVAITNEK